MLISTFPFLFISRVFLSSLWDEGEQKQKQKQKEKQKKKKKEKEKKRKGLGSKFEEIKTQ